MPIKFGLEFGNGPRDYYDFGSIAPGQQRTFHDLSSGQLHHLIARCLDNDTGGTVHDGGLAVPLTWQPHDGPPADQSASAENQIASIPGGGSYKRLVRPGDNLVAARLVLRHMAAS